MSIDKESKKNLIESFKKNNNDTGSTSIQIAIISERIKNLTEHFKTHNKDNHSKRKKLLSYLSKKNNKEYLEILKKLNIRGK